MTDPYIIPECGHNFQKEDIIEYVQKNNMCPMCRIKTEVGALRPNFQLKSIISEYEKERKK